MIRIIGIGLFAYLLFWLQRRIYQKIWNQFLEVKLQFSKENSFEGEKAELLEVIENRKRMPLPMLKVKFQTSRNLEFTDTKGSKVTDRFYRNDIFHIKGREKITRKLEFTAAKRGYYRIQNIDLITADFLLSMEIIEDRKMDSFFYVYPVPFSSKEFQQSLQQLNGEILTKRHWIEDPFEYRGIREYQPYDDMRSINWKATAKTGEFKVNQKNYTFFQTIRIFFNIEDNGVLKKEKAVEACFQIVAGLAAFFLHQGIRVACYGNGKDQIYEETVQIEASAGENQMQKIYRSLARIDTSKEAADFINCFKQKLLKEADGTITILVAPNAYDNFVNLILQCQKQGQECIWFYPTEIQKEPDIPEELKGCVKVLHLKS